MIHGSDIGGLIVCSSHGRSAAQFSTLAKQIAKDDPEPLVRVRAAEFLGLAGLADPRPAILNAIQNSNDGIEVGLMLNSLTLLQDGQPGYQFSVSEKSFKGPVLKNDTVKRRLEYLAP